MDKDKDMSRRRFLKMAALTTSLQAWRRCALGEHWDTEIRHSLFLQWDMAVWA